MTTATPTQPETATAADGAGSSDPARDAATWPLELREIPITAIEMGANVRSTPTPDDLAPLVASIKSRGILSPIRVAEVGAGKFELVYGQRRVMAAVIAGLATVPALVAAGVKDELHTIEQLLENLQREDLNPLDEAKAYRALLDAGLSQRQLAEQLGRAQPTIAMALRLLKVPEAIQAQVASGALSASHVKAIAGLPDAEQEEVARRAVEHKLSAHEVEREVSLAQQRAIDADKERDLAAEIVAKLTKQLAERKATQAQTSLVVVNAALAQLLIKAGWTVVEPKSKAGLYGGSKDACSVLEVRWYPNWGTTYGPDISAVCVDPEHQAARKEAEAKQRAKEEATYAKQREAVKVERHRLEAAVAQEGEAVKVERHRLEAAVAQEGEAIAAFVATGKWGADLHRVILAALAGESDDLFARHLNLDEHEALLQGADDPTWAVIEKLSPSEVLADIGVELRAQLAYGSTGALAKLQELAGVGAKPKVAKAGSKDGE